MNKVISLLVILLSVNAFAKVKVVATLPDVAEVVKAIGQDKVEVSSLLQGGTDPHFADARPDYILKVNRADVVCAMGLDLEIGWLPKVLEKAANSKVQSGGPGFCELGQAIKPLAVPTGVINRSLGDVHPHGNPHFALDPVKLGESGVEVVRVLTAVDAKNAEFYQKNYEAFKKQMAALHSEIQGKIKKVKVMEYHKEFTYFFESYGLESLGSLEEKPGMPPSATRIAQVAKDAKAGKVQMLFATASAPHQTLERFTELSGIPVIVVPSYIQQKGDANSIEALQNLIVKSMK
ncbi:metal ABC transporter substrate-binding protein [Bdellovibrio sp. HCB274]|uniref:metal ABC transporter substrate-binding protein n=1 Tax=Bdellovibrio sp. HCB274 TaxID=3394361 RepID=UPI0039B642E9